jgi:hypothetical protein
MHAILDVLGQHKEHLLAVVESEETTPDDKYEALMRLASLTGVLADAAAEQVGMPSLCRVQPDHPSTKPSSI